MAAFPPNIGVDPWFSGYGVVLYRGDAFQLLPRLFRVDAVITDPPYSARTHDGHNEATGEWADSGTRAAIGYKAWTSYEVSRFVSATHRITRGWIVPLMDHELIPAYERAFDAVDRYRFAPLPFVDPGSRVRRQGDGPSSWTTHILPARPRTREFLGWGTLPGDYRRPRGAGDRNTVGLVAASDDAESDPVRGRKPEYLLERLIRDYSRPKDIVLDPFAGTGTTGVAAMRMGRRAVLIELDRMAASQAEQRLREEQRRLERQPSLAPYLPERKDMDQQDLEV